MTEVISSETTSSRDQKRSLEVFTLITTVFIAGLCSIVYELLIATTVSYFEGDSVKYFSLTIGLYMASMGVGSFTSKYIEKNLLFRFTVIEIALGFLGGISIPALYFGFSHTNYFQELYYIITIMIGYLIGLEIPLLTRILKDYNSLRVNIAHVLSLDYFGALLATIAFPFILLPFLGTFRSGLSFGLVNMLIAFMIIRVFPQTFGRAKKPLWILSILATLMIAGTIFSAEKLLKLWDDSVFDGRVLLSQETKFQKIVLTKNKSEIRLFLDGNLQFSSSDEYRYHEALVHAPIQHTAKVNRVLLLGAGDGMAVRELLKYPEIEEITLVDLDPAVVKIARTNPWVREINNDVMNTSKKVSVLHQDAQRFLMENTQAYDFIIADLPDPNNNALVRLYSKAFYRLIRRNLTPEGIFVTQAASPFFTGKAFWSIQKTVAASGFSHTKPFHVLVPSFGDWGFVLAANAPLEMKRQDDLPATRFLNNKIIQNMFVFGKDLTPPDVNVNTLDRPILLTYYLDGWQKWSRQ
ncbi:polyamine aminopropyltransferase [Kiloniella sp. EL199]|uniref:polyamine aminopropyltransferase n=1 Tax=Kiloniella sp. EL199 TaxID=2107581 RepID=UPI000EA1F594|nr:polyamine aminopropyltransferase [Kiloniella sp. EL199]